MKNLLLVVLLLQPLALSCQSGPSKTSATKTSVPVVDARSLYERAGDSAELKHLLEADLKAGNPKDAFEGLEAFVLASLASGRTTRAQAALAGVKPELLFQRHGGQAYLTAVRHAVELLDARSGDDVEALYDAFARGNLTAVREALESPNGMLNPAALGELPELSAHAELLRAALDYEALRGGAELPGGAEGLAQRFDSSSAALLRAGESEAYFLSLVLAAQTLELDGARGQAIERWLLAAETEHWNVVGQDLQAAIGGRIRSYRNRVRDEVTAEVADEHRRELDAQRAEFDRKHDKALERIFSLESQLSRADRNAALDQVALDAARRTSRELMDRLGSGGSGSSGTASAEASWGFALDAAGAAADALTLWRGLRVLSPGARTGS